MGAVTLQPDKKGTVYTIDEVPIDVSVELVVKIWDEEDFIVSVALDPEGETDVLANYVFAALQREFVAERYACVGTKLSDISSRTRDRLNSTTRDGGCAFYVLDVAICDWEVTASGRSSLVVRQEEQHTEHVLRAETFRIEMEEQRTRYDLEYEQALRRRELLLMEGGLQALLPPDALKEIRLKELDVECAKHSAIAMQQMQQFALEHGFPFGGRRRLPCSRHGYT
jgi:hypothetical protein